MADSRSRAESHHRRNRDIPLTTADVTVTVTSVNENVVDCDISGGLATDNAIFVSQSADTEITFTLEDPTGHNLTFDTANPFANQNNRCPMKSTAKPKPPCKLGSNSTGNCFTMSIGPTNGKAVTYYRLNFAGGPYCDPIIIHD